MLRKFLVGAVCTLTLLACGKTVDGLLTNTEALTFKLKKNKTVSVPAGQWETTIKFPSKKEVKLEIKGVGAGETEVSFKVPKGAALPTENGDFNLTSKVSGQPYDVQGSLSTTYKDGPHHTDWQSCTYTVQRQECYYNGHANVCRWVTYHVQGMQHVRYFNRETTRTVHADLVVPGAVKESGSFHGVDVDMRRVIVNEGMCR